MEAIIFIHLEYLLLFMFLTGRKVYLQIVKLNKICKLRDVRKLMQTQQKVEAVYRKSKKSLFREEPLPPDV